VVRPDDAQRVLTVVSQSAARWQAVDSSEFDSMRWGDDIVLYALKTGETHALSAAHGATFLTLVEQSGSAQSAADWLLAMSAGDEPEAPFGAEAEADIKALVGVLSDLERIGVVERLHA
jgi:hypothetical protein